MKPTSIMLLGLFLTQSWTVYPQTPPSLEPPQIVEEEAPETLFALSLFDQTVELFLEGFWLARVTAGTGLLWDSRGLEWGRGPARTQQGFVVEQIPNFTLSLWMDERWYFETSYIGGFDRNTFALGFQALPDEWGIQKIRVGNSKITMNNYAGQEIAGGQDGSSGVVLRLGQPNSVQEFLVRYQKTGKEIRRFRGQREIESYRLAPGEFLRGREFSLASEGSPVEWQGLEVRFTEGSLPSRPPRSDEALILPKQARIRLQKPFEGRIEARLRPGDPWLVLWDQGRSSQWEIKNLYPIPQGFSLDEWNWEGSVVLRGSETVQEQFLVTLADDIGFIEVRNTSPSGTPEHPFLGEYGPLYDPLSQDDPAYFTQEILLTFIRKNPSLSLGPGVVPQSVQVFRNGRATPEAKLDPSSGVLSFPYIILETDQIEAEFERESANLGQSQLFLSQGNRWVWSENGKLETWLSGSWTWEKDQWTTEANTTPGGIRAVVEAQDSLGLGLWKLQWDTALTTPDTTGMLRPLLGESRGLQPLFSSYTLRPASLPQTTFPDDPGLLLTPQNRGRLRYTDFWSVDPLGQPYLAPYDAVRTPTALTEKTGPSFAGSGSGIQGRVMLLDYVLESSEAWVGSQIYPSPGALNDLSSSTQIRFKLLHTGPVAPRIFLQAGLLSEDWEGTGQVLRPQGSGSSRGVSFLDQGSGRQGPLIYPLEPSVDWGNDPEGKGYLRIEDPNRSWSKEITYSSVNQWQEVVISLSAQEAARLTHLNSLRFLVVRSGAGTLQGKVLIGDLEILGSSYIALSGAVEGIENSSEGFFTGYYTPTDSWHLRRLTSPLTLGQYKTLSWTYRSTDPGAQIELNWLDAQGRGIHYQWITQGTGQWETIKLNLESSTIDHPEGFNQTLNIEKAILPLTSLEWKRVAPSLPQNGPIQPGNKHVFEVKDLALTDPIVQWTSQFRGQLNYPWEWEGLGKGGIQISAQANWGELLSRSSLNWDSQWIKTRWESQLDWTPERWTIDLQYNFKLGATLFWWEENYSPQRLREEILSLDLGSDWGLQQLSLKVIEADILQTQNWAFRWSALEQKLLMQANLSQEKKRDSNLVGENHWFTSWQDLLPTEDQDWIRKTGLASLEWKDLENFWVPQFLISSSSTHNRTSNLSTGSLRWQIQMPISWKEEGQRAWNLTPSLQRMLQWSHTGGQTGWSDFSRAWLESLGSLAPLWGDWPLMELQTSQTMPALLDSLSSLTRWSQVGLTLQRPLFLDLWDLVIPGRISASIQGTQTLSAQELQGIQNWNLEAEGLALGLYSILGSNPLMQNITGDEYRWKIGYKQQQIPSKPSTQWDVGASMNWIYSDTGEWKLSLGWKALWESFPQNSSEVQLSLKWPFLWEWADEVPRWLVPRPKETKAWQTLQLFWNQFYTPEILSQIGQKYIFELLLVPQSTLSGYIQSVQEFSGDFIKFGLDAGIELKLTF